MPRTLPLLLLLASALTAQAQPLDRPTGQTRPPALLTQQAKQWVPLELTALKAEVDLAGLIARTRVTMTFANPNARILEGELVFPLPEGATISGYGLDVQGVVVAASAVGRQAARVAFETEVRKGIDPGLVEWVRGNVFRTRVYPVPAKGSRTVRVEYIVDLSRSPVLRVPLDFGKPLAHLSVQISASGTDAPPVVSGTSLPLKFTEEHGRYRARATAKQVASGGDLTLKLGEVPAQIALVEQRQERGQPVHYFSLSQRVKPSKRATDERAAPKRIGLVWDASLSRLRSDRARELALIGSKLKALGRVEVDAFILRDQLGPRTTFQISGGDASALIAHLSKAPIDGGTQLGTLALAKLVDDRSYDWWLLCTDGLGTLGARRPLIGAPTYIISASPAAHHALLRQLSERSGGAYLNLRRVENAAAMTRIGGSPQRALVGIDAPEGAVSDVLPRGRAVFGDRIAISGKLLVAKATITLRFSDGSKTSVELQQAGAGSSGLVPRLWAGMQLADLALQPDRNRRALIRLGKRFGLVTPHTSLLVLETLQQHLTHGVLPPTERPALRAAYLKAVETQGLAESKRRTDKLAQVSSWWAQRSAWYRQTFTYPANFRYASAAKDKEERESNGGRAPARRPRGGAAGGERSKSLGGKPGSGDSGAKIQIKAWDPKTPYMARLKEAGPGEAYAVYLAQRTEYAGSPAFYLDCSEYFQRQKMRHLGLRILSSILELQIDDAPLLRVVAHRLHQLGQHDHAVGLFERVRQLRPEEPQSHRDLALALVGRAEAKGSRSLAADYQRAASLLRDVILGNWHGRFPQIEVIALTELNRIRSRHSALKIDLPASLLTAVDVDIRILLTWDADATDIDLWIIEPSGEKCMYNHARTTIGGLMTKDFTRGYGPEVYLIRKAMPGSYKVQCNFYGSSQQKLTGGTTIQATVITNYGRPNEQRKTVTVRLSKAKDVVDLGSIAFGK